MEFSRILDLLLEIIQMPFGYFINANKRVYIIYCITSLVLAFYIFKKNKQSGNFIKYLFSKNIYGSTSAFIDYGFLFFNALIKVLLIAPFLYLSLYIAFYTHEYLITQFGSASWHLSENTSILCYTLALVLIGDFASFFMHWLMHKIPFLWEFHKIHHSATTLNPFTQYRLHPFEIILNNAKAIIIVGLVTGFFDYFSNNILSKHTIIGVNIFSFLFLLFGANLRHSHVPFKYFNFLEYVLISPYQHQIHHSDRPADFDKNMGSKLAIWDYLFGTLKRSEEVKKVSFGLGLGQDKDYDTFSKNLWNPFKNNYKKLVHLFKKT